MRAQRLLSWNTWRDSSESWSPPSRDSEKKTEVLWWLHCRECFCRRRRVWLAGAGRNVNEKADVKPPMRQSTSLSRLLIGFSMEPCTGIQSRRKKRGCLDSDTHTTDEEKQHDRDLNPALQPQGAVATESKATKQGRREHNSKI